MNTHTAEQPVVKRLERSRSDRMLAGVSGGLARYFGIHPAFYRVGFVVLTLIGGAGLLIYLAAALVMPDEGKEDSIASAALRDRRDRPWPIIGLGLIGVGVAVLLSRASVWPHGDVAWILLLVAGGVILWLSRKRPFEAPRSRPVRRPRRETGARHRDDPSRCGVHGGRTGARHRVPGTIPARRHGVVRPILIGLGSLVALVLVAVAVFVAIFPVHLSRGVGERTYVPATLGDLHQSYRLGVGNLKLDLTNVRLPVGETRVTARVDVGDLEVVVPQLRRRAGGGKRPAGLPEPARRHRRRPKRRRERYGDGEARARPRHPRQRGIGAGLARRTMRHAASELRLEQ